MARPRSAGSEKRKAASRAKRAGKTARKIVVAAAVVEVVCLAPTLARSGGNSIDHIYVPPPPNIGGQAAMAADARAVGPISQTLHRYQLTPAQLISVRNYIGQYDEKTKIVSAGSVNGVDLFAIKNSQTGDYIGQVELRAGSNGEIVVNKVTAAQLDLTHKVEIPVAGTVNGEEASKLLGGSAVMNVLTTEEKNKKADMELPAISAAAGADYGVARQATAHFLPDGSGYEYGLTTKIASGNAEAKAGVTGVAVGGGARGPEVEGFANYFGKPQVDNQGRFTRTVLGGSANIHGTLAEVEAKLGCADNEPCNVETALGALGVGAGLGLVFSPHVDIPVKPASQIEDEGIATPPATPSAAESQPQVPSAEQQAYDHAVESGDTTTMENFLETYPQSDLAPKVENLLDMGAAPDPTAPVQPTGY